MARRTRPNADARQGRSDNRRTGAGRVDAPRHRFAFVVLWRCSRKLRMGFDMWTSHCRRASRISSIAEASRRRTTSSKRSAPAVAFIDYDNDGNLDIFAVNGSRLEGFPKGQEPTNHLYHNEGHGIFKDVTRESGLARSGWGQGVCAGDFDNDGFTDLFVTYWGHDVLYQKYRQGRLRGRDGGGGDVRQGCPLGDRLRLRRLQPGRQAGSVRIELRAIRSAEHSDSRQAQCVHVERYAGHVRPPGLEGRRKPALAERFRAWPGEIHGRIRGIEDYRARRALLALGDHSRLRP